MNQDIQTILLSEERLKEIVADLGRRISEDYKDKNLLMVSVLKGSVAVSYTHLDVYKRQVHVSGHACQEELKIVQGLVKPKYFIPVHGEQKHLRKHADLAIAMGRDPSHVFIGDNGNVLELNENYIKQLAPVPAGRVLVDGLGVGDVGSIVLRDRKHLGQDGLIVVVATIDSSDGHVISGPDIVSRGFVYVRESEPLMLDARARVTDCLLYTSVQFF